MPHHRPGRRFVLSLLLRRFFLLPLLLRRIFFLSLLLRRFFFLSLLLRLRGGDGAVAVRGGCERHGHAGLPVDHLEHLPVAERVADAAADAEDDQHAEVPQRARVGGDARVLERPLANAGEDAVRADEEVEATRRAVVERHRHPGA